MCELPITHDAYQKYLKPDSLLTVYLKGTVQETGLSYAKIDTISMRRPSLTVKVGYRKGSNTSPGFYSVLVLIFVASLRGMLL